jgi:hypothetical protein
MIISLLGQVCFCPICCGVITRGEIREKYGYEGSFFSDLCILCVCSCCAVAQQTRELQLQGVRPGLIVFRSVVIWNCNTSQLVCV